MKVFAGAPMAIGPSEITVASMLPTSEAIERRCLRTLHRRLCDARHCAADEAGGGCDRYPGEQLTARNGHVDHLFYSLMFVEGQIAFPPPAKTTANGREIQAIGVKSVRGVARTLAARGRRRAAEYGSVKDETPKVARAEMGADT